MMWQSYTSHEPPIGQSPQRVTRGFRKKHTKDKDFALKLVQKKYNEPDTRNAMLAIRVLTPINPTVIVRNPMMRKNERPRSRERGARIYAVSSLMDAAYRLSVTRPKFDKDAKFELKGQFLKELRDNTFSGSENKDANEHIKRVFEIVDLFTTPDVTQDQLMLHVFPISLTRVASRCGPHYSKDCPLKEEGNTLEEAYYTQFGEPFPNARRYRAAALRFYQRDNGNPSYQERRQTMEESLSNFMAESAKRHDENSFLIKEIRASTNAAIKNQGALIKALEI
ncbi:hypothetical protein Tco_0209504 [Tanacetum coccineum]